MWRGMSMVGRVIDAIVRSLSVQNLRAVMGTSATFTANRRGTAPFSFVSPWRRRGHPTPKGHATSEANK